MQRTIKLLLFITFISSYLLTESWADNIVHKDDIGEIKSNVSTITTKEGKPIEKLDFSSDNIEYNFKEDLVIATGNVTFRSGNRILIADRVFYNAKNNIIFAEGNVYFKDETGHDFYSSYLEIDSELHSGILKDFSVLFKNGASLSSHLIEKTNAEKYNIVKPCYTNCKTEGDEIPTWQLKASKGIYNSLNETITFYNSWLELKNIPIIWSPFLHFSNLEFKRKIGLLTPELKNTSTYGSSLVIPFYIPFGNHQDLTISTFLALSKEPDASTKLSVISRNPLLYIAKYNGYFSNGEFNMNAGYATKEVDGKSNWHYFLNYKMDLTDYLRTSIRIEKTSDFKYLNKYDINPKNSSESFLVNNINFEAFINDNNYTKIGGYNYYYTNPAFIKSTEPYTDDITLKHKYMSDYNKWGKLNVTGLISKYFFDNNENLNRAVLNANYTYYTPTISGNYKIDTTLQSVNYFLNDNSPKLADDKYSAAAISLTWDYTFLSLLELGNLSFTPLVQLTVSSNLDTNKNNPIVDSYVVNTTVNNLFKSNHYSGYDIFEDAQNIKYGLEASFLSLDNKGSRLFIGQIKNIDYLSRVFANNKYINQDSNYLSQNKSNYYIATDVTLGGFYLNYEGILDLSYKNLEDNITIGYRNSLFGVRAQHSSYNGLDPEVFTFTKVEEIVFSGYIKLSQFTSFDFSTTYGSNNNVPIQLRANNFALRWLNDCLDVTGYFKREYNTSYTRVDSYGVKIKISSIG